MNKWLVIVVLSLLSGCADLPTGSGETPTPDPVPAAARLEVARASDTSERRAERLSRLGHESIASSNVGFYLDVQTARLRQELRDRHVAVTREGQALTITFPGHATFDQGSARISAAMAPVLDVIAGILEEYRASLVIVTGHTDSQGARGLNQRLSEQRALAVGLRLLDRGIERDRLVVLGEGPDHPVADNDTAEGRAANRRVELLIKPLVKG